MQFFIMAIMCTGFDNGTIGGNIERGRDFIMVSVSDDSDGKIQANDNDEGSLSKSKISQHNLDKFLPVCK